MGWAGKADWKIIDIILIKVSIVAVSLQKFSDRGALVVKLPVQSGLV